MGRLNVQQDRLCYTNRGGGVGTVGNTLSGVRFLLGLIESSVLGRSIMIG